MRTKDAILDYLAWLVIRLTMTDAFKTLRTIVDRVFG